jgi:tripartite-type tricarboxylate transporter receptor subunit TctC
MKKIFSIVLVVVMALSMVACGTTKTPQTTPTPPAADGTKAPVNFPTKDITYVVPYSAGGSSDQMARLMSNYAPKYLGVNIVIENIPGGAGNVGLVQFAGYKKDGYSIASANTTMNLQPIYGTTEYDYLEIFEPLALVVSIPIAITVTANSPFKTIEELIDYAKENPGKLQYGHAGIGSITHVTAELFAMSADIELTQVPFGSGNDALTALMGEHIDIDVASLSEVLPHHESGTVRILAMCTDKQVGDIPTLISKGYDVDMKVTQGICTHKGVDPDIIKILDEGLNGIVNDPGYQAELEALGMEVDYLNAEEFGEFLQNQRKTFEEVVTSAGILEMVKSQQK